MIGVEVISGAVQDVAADAIIVNLFKDAAAPGGAAGAVDKALDGAISDLIAGGDFDGSLGQVAVLYPRGVIPAQRVLVVGLGPQEDFDAERVRRAAASAVLKARDLHAQTVATIVHGAGAGGLEPETAAYATVEGSLLALYEYVAPRREAEGPQVKQLQLVVLDDDAVKPLQGAADRAAAVVAGVYLTRDMVNHPPNVCTPAYMAEQAVKVAEDVGLRVQVLERGQMEALGMGALLGVAQGTDTPPRFIILEHNAERAAELDSLVLVGKGVTFDTGGYSLKAKQGMATMKVDMAGGAAVIGAMRAIGALDVPLHVVGLVPASDNMINGSAYRPQDVVTASNGVSIEIVSTDAEGRMLLADALVFAKRFNPAAVVDIATLTGACMTALGGQAAGVFATNDALRDALLGAADLTGERLWPLPLYTEYEKPLESLVADLKNSAGVPYTGVGVSASFLKRFVDYPAWGHIDMAGLASNRNGIAYQPEGASGFGVRVLTEFVRQWAL